MSEDYGWEDLQYMVQQLFAGQISPRDPMTLRFKDPEGDWVTMGGEDEFNLAKQLTPKLHISVSQKELASSEMNSIPQVTRLWEEVNGMLLFCCLAEESAGETERRNKHNPRADPYAASQSRTFRAPSASDKRHQEAT